MGAGVVGATLDAVGDQTADADGCIGTEVIVGNAVGTGGGAITYGAVVDGGVATRIGL